VDAQIDGRSDGRLNDARDASDSSDTPGVLKLVAGKVGGPGKQDGVGTAAQFVGPWAVTSDGAGNLFVADRSNNTIRKIAIATGAVTTLAGSPGLSGSSEGTGTAARFSSPMGVAYDGSGNLFVADTDSSTIRKVVVATGVVTTFAGSAGNPDSTDGTGTAARFSGPEGMASDGVNLFVADVYNHTIRQIEIATGVVTTLAGSPGTSGSTDGTGTAARFNSPTAIASDGAGNLFVADTNNHTIRQVVVSTGAVTTLAGSPGTSGSTNGNGTEALFNNPMGVATAISNSAKTLLVADNGNNVIRSIAIDTGAVTTLAGSVGLSGNTDGVGAIARFNYPGGMVTVGANLYVADWANYTIRKVVLSTGAVTTFAGSPLNSGSTDGTGASARFNVPEKLANDSDGSLFVADSLNHVIRKVVVSTGVVSTLVGSAGNSGITDGVGTAARFNEPAGLASDGLGNLFVANTSSNTIRQIVIDTATVTTLAGYWAGSGSADGTGTDARFNRPYGLASDGAGDLFVADQSNHTIRKVVVSTGAVTTLAGSAGTSGSADGTGTAAGFNDPMGVAFDGEGNLFVADTENHTIRKIVVTTGAVTTFAGSAGNSGSSDGTGTAARFNYPLDIASDKAGNLFVADTENHTIRKIVIATQVVTTVVGVPEQNGVVLGALPAGLASPAGLAFGPSGELLISDRLAQVILAAWF